jgi:hypothetical protein
VRPAAPGGPSRVPRRGNPAARTAEGALALRAHRCNLGSHKLTPFDSGGAWFAWAGGASAGPAPCLEPVSRVRTAIPLRMIWQVPPSGPAEHGRSAATRCASPGRPAERAPGGPARPGHAVAPGSETPACRSCSSLPASCPQRDSASPLSTRHHRHDRNMQSKLHLMFAVWPSHDASAATTLLLSNTDPLHPPCLGLRVRGQP